MKKLEEGLKSANNLSLNEFVIVIISLQDLTHLQEWDQLIRHRLDIPVFIPIDMIGYFPLIST